MGERNFLNLCLIPCYNGDLNKMIVASIDVRDRDIMSEIVDSYIKMRDSGRTYKSEFVAYIPKTTESRLNNIIYSPYVGDRNTIRTGYYSESPYGGSITKYKSYEGILVETSSHGLLYYSTIIENEKYSWNIYI